MRSRLAVMIVCALTALGGAATPALAAGHNDRAKTPHHRKAMAHHVKAAAGGGATTAAAERALNECQNSGQLTSTDFTRADLKKALSIMSSSTSQYSDCSDVLHNALASLAAGRGIKTGAVKGSGGGSSTTTIVIIVVVVLLVLAALLGGLAIRRRRGHADVGDGDGGDDAGEGGDPPATS